jgi:hypothetical protein
MISPATQRLEVTRPMVRTIRPGSSWRGIIAAGHGRAGADPLGLCLEACLAAAAVIPVGAHGPVPHPVVASLEFGGPPLPALLGGSRSRRSGRCRIGSRPHRHTGRRG